MINILTGPPRCGKTYFVCKWLSENYIKYNKEKLTYEIKNDALIISNIKGLRLPHRSLDDVLKENEMKAEEFFVDEIQQELSKKYPTIIYIIDEAHRYFPLELTRKSQISRNLRDYFAFHGHYNQHFWLLTQDCSLLFTPLIKLAECEYQTMRMSISPPGRFHYNMRVPGKTTKFNSVSLKKDKKIFSLYDSAEVKETEKPKRTKIYLYLALTLAFVIISTVQGLFDLKKFGEKLTGKDKNIESRISEDIKKDNENNEIKPEKLPPQGSLTTKIEDTIEKWVALSTVFDPVKKEIMVQDDEFGLVALQDFPNEYRVHRGRIYTKKLIVINNKKESGMESAASVPLSFDKDVK